MTFSNEIIVLMLNLIILGMTVHAKSLYGGLKATRPSRALIMTFASANLTSVSALSFIWVSPVFLTLTNTLLLSTLCCAVLTVRSWRLPLELGLVRGCVAFMLCIALVFEFLRQNGSYLQRVVVYSTLSALFFVWLFYEAWKKQRQDNSFQLKFLMGVSVASLGFRLARMTAALMQDVQPASLFHEGSATAVFRLMSLSTDVLILSSLLGYCTYVLTLRNQRTEEDRQRVQAANLSLSASLAENNQMLKALTMSLKSHNMGVVVATLAHELRQPLHSIQLNAEYITSGKSVSRAEDIEILKSVLRENSRAADLVEGLRNIFMNKVPPRRSSMALSSWLQEWVQARALSVLTDKGIALELHAQSDLQVRVHASQIEVVLSNLLLNAEQALAGQADGRIDLSLTCVGGYAQLDVLDNGPGIDADLMEKIFEMGYTTRPEGMGMGLWLCQRIVQMHGGQLINIPITQGTQMRLTLPLYTPSTFSGTS